MAGLEPPCHLVVCGDDRRLSRRFDTLWRVRRGGRHDAGAGSNKRTSRRRRSQGGRTPLCTDSGTSPLNRLSVPDNDLRGAPGGDLVSTTTWLWHPTRLVRQVDVSHQTESSRARRRHPRADECRSRSNHESGEASRTEAMRANLSDRIRRILVSTPTRKSYVAISNVLRHARTRPGRTPRERGARPDRRR